MTRIQLMNWLFNMLPFVVAGVVAIVYREATKVSPRIK